MRYRLFIGPIDQLERMQKEQPIMRKHGKIRGKTQQCVVYIYSAQTISRSTYIGHHAARPAFLNIDCIINFQETGHCWLTHHSTQPHRCIDR